MAGRSSTVSVEQGMSTVVVPTSRHTGRIAGAVLEMGGQRPIPGARIVVNDSLLGHTGADGWFDIPLPAATHLQIRIQAIGYSSQRFELERPGNGSLNARVFLAKAPLDGCGLPGAELDGGTLMLVVRDAATGRAPDREVRAEIAGPGGTRWASTASDGGDRFGLQVMLGRAGRYAIRVSAEGYEDWFEPGVTLQSATSCLFKTAWLVQTDR